MATLYKKDRAAVQRASEQKTQELTLGLLSNFRAATPSRIASLGGGGGSGMPANHPAAGLAATALPAQPLAPKLAPPPEPPPATARGSRGAVGGVRKVGVEARAAAPLQPPPDTCGAGAAGVDARRCCCIIVVTAATRSAMLPPVLQHTLAPAP
eukprot:CAMPEP_0204181306 /NCGR_PEP_ID=MMETSP0361-20130328/51779_1 /ASSEMBLY_ACC=CAM_ASM_000343 /TAXON_ID=268821 /ORGANISM="Scrippsiella Hangoei, Strain SHTV-5" /LENGTH=153 /DNA_ID=CAMNT_0051140861 /DNA_START=51 /DNA_END=510 /DNA_ORIENTATION=+